MLAYMTIMVDPQVEFLVSGTDNQGYYISGSHYILISCNIITHFKELVSLQMKAFLPYHSIIL